MANYSDNESMMRSIAQDVLNENETSDQFAVAQTPYHTHNDADSPAVDYSNIKNRLETLHVVISGTSAATAANYGMIFIAPYTAMFVGAYEVHGTLGTSGSAVSVQIEKLVGTQASGSGTSLLAAGFNLKSAINTVQTASLAVITKNNFALNKGDRLGLVLTGTPTSVAQLVIVAQLQY